MTARRPRVPATRPDEDVKDGWRNDDPGGLAFGDSQIRLELQRQPNQNVWALTGAATFRSECMLPDRPVELGCPTAAVFGPVSQRTSEPEVVERRWRELVQQPADIGSLVRVGRHAP